MLKFLNVEVAPNNGKVINIQKIVIVVSSAKIRLKKLCKQGD